MTHHPFVNVHLPFNTRFFKILFNTRIHDVNGPLYINDAIQLYVGISVYYPLVFPQVQNAIKRCMLLSAQGSTRKSTSKYPIDLQTLYQLETHL